jgi:hypothetical protein
LNVVFDLAPFFHRGKRQTSKSGPTQFLAGGPFLEKKSHAGPVEPERQAGIGSFGDSPNPHLLHT